MDGRQNEAPDQRLLVEGGRQQTPVEDPQPSYPGFPVASTRSDLDRFVNEILWGCRR